MPGRTTGDGAGVVATHLIPARCISEATCKHLPIGSSVVSHLSIIPGALPRNQRPLSHDLRDECFLTTTLQSLGLNMIVETEGGQISSMPNVIEWYCTDRPAQLQLQLQKNDECIIKLIDIHFFEAVSTDVQYVHVTSRNFSDLCNTNYVTSWIMRRAHSSYWAASGSKTNKSSSLVSLEARSCHELLALREANVIP